MRIAVLGTGNMGSGLAQLAVESDYDVIVAGRDLTKAQALAEKLGPKVRSADFRLAAAASDVIILAVPFKSVEEVLQQAGDLSGKTIIDLTNPLSDDYMSLTVGHTTSAAEQVAELATGARVVKAFNTIFAQLLPRIARSNGPRVQVFTAADDEPAREIVHAFIVNAGFEPIAAGGLTNARFIEPVAELNIHLGYALGWGTAIAPAWVKLAA